jgi:C-terminal processing protease CtpA/Prc
LIVWAPDDKQSFPTDFGADGMLFTKDDPVTIIPAGYNLIDLNQKPFRVYKELEPKIDLNEGEGAVKDFSKMQYGEAFDTMFKRASVEYPFTTEKKIDWEALFAKYSPQAAKARGDNEFYQIIHDLTLEFPDGHVGPPFNAKVFYRECGGGFGMLLTELSDKRVIVSKIFPSGPAAEANIQEGMEIISWNDQPIGDAISQVIPYFGIGSTEHTKRLAQILFLTRVAPDMQVKIKYKNLQSKEIESTLKAISEYDSLQFALYGEGAGTVSLPIEAKMLGDSGMAYININTFSDDDNLEARLWDRHLKKITDEKIPGLILDLRRNGGGNFGLAVSFAGYFFDQEIPLCQRSYYNENTKSFEVESIPTRIKPAPILYSGKIAVLVSPDCVSACEGFTYAMAQNGRAKIIGHYPTAGAFGEIGRGQYKLPGDINLQFPTGKPESMDGNLIIENTGVIPDIFVPITRESALDKQDALLETALKEVSQ